MEQRVTNIGQNWNSQSYFEGSVESLELHMFVDSSQEVFQRCRFFTRKRKVTNGNCTSTKLAFVYMKARVAPMKSLTIPKLELQASLLAARLRRDIQNALTMQIDTIFIILTAQRVCTGCTR